MNSLCDELSELVVVSETLAEAEVLFDMASDTVSIAEPLAERNGESVPALQREGEMVTLGVALRNGNALHTHCKTSGIHHHKHVL